MSINNFNFTGNLGSDAEQRFTKDNKSVVSFSVAVTSGYGDNKVTNWVKGVIWGKLGEAVVPYLKKGTSVAANGELSLNEWKDKEGKDRTTVEVNISQIHILGGKKDEPEPAKRSGQDAFEKDIPF